ncbi:MAG: hypothetical protein AAF664_02415, partial [Planctomycetota bacterium]
MRRLHPAGIFEALCSGEKTAKIDLSNDRTSTRDELNYRIEMTNELDETTETIDPYAVPSILSDFDRYLIGEGKHHDLYNRLGAQLR